MTYLEPRVSGLSGPSARDFTSAARVVANQQVRSVRFESQIGPPVQIDPRRQREPGGAINEALLRFIRPALYVDTTFGTLEVAPWGAPRANFFWPLAILLGVGAAVSLGLVVRGVRR